MPSTTFIYALCEPHSRTVRYIGKANDPKYRFKQHLRQSVRAKTHLGNWLRSLLSLGEKPNLVVLREVPDEHRELAEERYIRLARGLGMKLVNGTDGGEGCYNPSEETRFKIGSANRGKSASEATRYRMSKAKLGVSRTPEFCANLSAALKGKSPPKTTTSAAHTDKANEKRRRSLTGVPKSVEHREALKAAWARRKAARV